MRSWIIRTALCNLLLLLLTGAAQAQQVVRITEPTAINPAEVTIAINPKNPDNMIAASFQTGMPPKPRAGSYHYVTFDGGKTWATIGTPNPKNLVQGDDVLAFSNDGVAYHAHLSFDGIRLARPVRAENGMIVNVSKDGGNTWSDGTPAINHVNTVIPFEDKPGLIVDNAPGSRFKGNVYLAWTRFDVYGSADPEHHSQIYFTRSTDQGQTFSMPFRISDTGGDCLDSDNTVEGAVPAVGPNGEVYVVWAGPLGLVFDKSKNGGETWTAPVRVNDDALKNGKAQFFTWMSIDPADGSVNIVFYDRRDGNGTETGLTLARSVDGGRTFVNHKIDVPLFNVNERV